MNRRRPRSGDLGVNMGPFSDIAFLLIVFFLVTTTFIKNTGTQMDIPSGDSKGQSKDKTPTILLTKDEIRFNEKPTDLKALEKTLREKKFSTKEDDERIVILESQDNVPYQRYFTVVSLLNDTGAVMALMTQEKSDK